MDWVTTVKIILSKLIYRFNKISIKIKLTILRETEKHSLKLTLNFVEPCGQSILNKNKIEDTLSDFRIYYRMRNPNLKI